MNAISSKRKGKAGELEIVNLIKAAFPKPWPVERNLAQSRSGGCDIIWRDYAIEVKRTQDDSPSIMDRHWRQAQSQAGELGLKPVLIYRRNNRPWRARRMATFNGVPILVDVLLSDWLETIR